MAGRLLFQKVSGIFKSTSHLGPHASVSARAATPEGAVRTLRSLFHGPAVHHGAAVTSNPGIQGCAARYFNTVASSLADAKTKGPTAGMPSMDCFKGLKRTFSSGASSKHGILDRAANIGEYSAALDRSSATTVAFATILCLYWIYYSGGRTTRNKGPSISPHCPGCNCKQAVQNPSMR